jgi:polyhydroxyalkanoate synthesis regulator phasin
MDLRRNWKLALTAAVAVAVAGAGGAIAATKLTSPSERSQAIVNDAAKQLGVDPSKLQAALKKAIENQIDAEVAAGRLTKEQGDALKQRIESSDLPLFGQGLGHLRGAPGFGFGHRLGGVFGGLDTAATYLGMSESDLRAELVSGKSLADVAKEKSKSVDGLVTALVADASKQLDAAVKAGRLTQAQADQFKADLKTRVQARVNNARPQRELRGFRGNGGGFFAPPRIRGYRA